MFLGCEPPGSHSRVGCVSGDCTGQHSSTFSLDLRRYSLLLDSFAHFAMEGFGTPAPIAPPSHLVIGGLYRYVLNPMYVAVSALVFGQGLLFGSLNVLKYGLAVIFGFHLFVLLYEEPVLHRKFGDEYDAYCKNVRRWWPRIKPWKPAE